MPCHGSGMPEKSQTVCFEKVFIQHGNKMTPINHKKLQKKEFLKVIKIAIHWALQKIRIIKLQHA